MSAFSDLCKAVVAVFSFQEKKFLGDREDRLKREEAKLKSDIAKWQRRDEGWRQGNAGKILGG